jgi:hypothetical protein
MAFEYFTSMYDKAIFAGDYKTTDQTLDDARVVTVFDFGGPASKEALALYTAENIFPTQVPVIAHRKMVGPLRNVGIDPELVIEGHVVNNLGRGVGSWGELRATKLFMDEHDMDRFGAIAHRYHVARIALQAATLGIADRMIIPEGLPDAWDKTADQSWTRNKLAWQSFSLIASPILRIKHQI